MNFHQLAQAINKSKYQLVAVGWRDVGMEELEHVLKIIVESKPEYVTAELNQLYEEHPNTIALDEALAGDMQVL